MPVSRITQRFVDDLLGAQPPSRDEFYWHERMPGFGVNVSPYQLRRPGFAERLLHTLDTYGMHPSRFVVESSPPARRTAMATPWGSR